MSRCLLTVYGTHHVHVLASLLVAVALIHCSVHHHVQTFDSLAQLCTQQIRRTGEVVFHREAISANSGGVSKLRL